MRDVKLLDSETEYIVFIDDDDIYPRYYLLQLLHPNWAMWRIKIMYWWIKFKNIFQ